MKKVYHQNGSRVFLGEAVDLLRTMPDNYIDFCYIDPPFMTQKVQKGHSGSYSDQWPDLSSYVTEMAHLCKMVRQLLKPTGTMMVHVDPRTAHYLKVALDERVFGRESFVNEIVWCYQSGGAGRRTLAKKHDTILWYAKTDNYKFNIVREAYGPHNTSDKNYHPEGKMLSDWWPIRILPQSSRERVGYPNQKPRWLLERCLKVSTNTGDRVLDFFCGSGTTAVVAQEMDRKFVVCDRNPEAIQHTLDRLT